ncbi:MAG: HD-GYP domain-containing protein [bacterium]
MDKQAKGSSSAVLQNTSKTDRKTASAKESQRQENRSNERNLNAEGISQSQLKWKDKFLFQLEQVNKELWLILSMFIIVGLMNYLVVSHRMLLSLYMLPTIFSAYFYGRRHATLTAVASILLVGLGTYYNPAFFANADKVKFLTDQWYDLMAWGSMLIITAYAMGTLYEHKASQIKELRTNYQGILIILRHFISKDEFSESHCYRVSHYAAKIAAYLGFSPERIEDIRSAGLLHDIGKLEVSRELLYKATQFTQKEFEGMKRYVKQGMEISNPFAGPLGRVIPIILAHQSKENGSKYKGIYKQGIPLEAKVLTIADVYDTLVSEHPYRKSLQPSEANDIITKGSGSEYDPQVVEAFSKAFRNGELEVHNMVI